MDQVFGGNAVIGEEEAMNVVEEPKKTNKSDKVKQMKEALKNTIRTQPDFTERHKRLSDSLQVVNTLGFGSSNIVVDRDATEKSGKRELRSMSMNVGYRIKNIGKEAITYQTEVYAEQDGKFVGNKVTKTLKPGETADIARKYMTMLCALPEFSFTLANGTIIASSKRDAKTLGEELESYYFKFNKNEDGSRISVNDDEVKINIDGEDGKVKPEFVETFGFLNNEKTREASGGNGKKYSAQDLAANFVRMLIEQSQEL